MKVKCPSPSSGLGGLGSLCVAREHSTSDKIFNITCNPPPAEGNELHYVVGNLPEHVFCDGVCRA
jgi:hypothetical protein